MCTKQNKVDAYSIEFYYLCISIIIHSKYWLNESWSIDTDSPDMLQILNIPHIIRGILSSFVG